MNVNFSPTQTIVNFLTQTTSGSTASLDETQLIFDFEISQAARDYFLIAMQTFKTTTEDYIANMPAGGDAQMYVDYALAVMAILRPLREWATMKHVDAQGNQIQVTAAAVDSLGNPILDSNNQPILVAASFDPTTGQFKTTEEYDPTTGQVLYQAGTIRTTMNRYMGETLDELIRTFRAAGWDPTDINEPGTVPASTVYQIYVAYDAGLNTYPILDIMDKAIVTANDATISEDVYTQSESLQQLLMVDYIARGNELLFTEMTKLKEAININQDILSYLNSLQDLMNQKDPQHFIMQLQYLAGATEEDENMWQTFEDETFNQELGTTCRISDTSAIDLYVSILQGYDPNDLLAIQPYVDGSQLTGTALSHAVGTAAGAFVDRGNDYFNGTIQQIIDNLDDLKAKLDEAAGTVGSALSNQITTIRQDFYTLQQDAIDNGTNPIQLWIRDYEAGREGEFQSHLNDAVVSSQALNDTEREELRRVMFVYEEFYKSATAMLSRMTQLLERIAAAISR